jgi:hypothetical protein
MARRVRVLHLLALVENRAALPADAALRLAEEILMMTGPEAVMYRCDAVALPEADDEAGTDRRSS